MESGSDAKTKRAISLPPSRNWLQNRLRNSRQTVPNAALKRPPVSWRRSPRTAIRWR